MNVEHAVVCGAGVVGAAVADALSRHVPTTLLDAHEVGTGTTGASFSWINASSKAPYAYHALNAAGVAAHLRLGSELPSDDWLHVTGTLLWGSRGCTTEPHPAFVRDLEGWGFTHRRLDRRLLAELEPGLAVHDDVVGVAVADEGWVDAPTLARLLAARAEERGAVVRLGARVVGADRGPGAEIRAVRLRGGDRIACDAVVNCGGAAAADLAVALGVPPPPLAEGTDGLLVRLAVDPVPVEAVAWSPTVHVRADGPGVLLTGDDAVDSLLAAGDEREAVAELCRRTADLVPAAAGAEVLDVRVGTRPKPVDRWPSVGALRGHPGYYEVVTHSGVTLAPVLGQILAEELVTGAVDPLVAPYRPARFPGRDRAAV